MKTNNPIKNVAQDLNREFFIEETRVAEKHSKKYSASLAIRETQIKTTLRFHLTPVRMKKTNKASASWKGSQPSPEKLHLAADGNNYRDSQPESKRHCSSEP